MVKLGIKSYESLLAMSALTKEWTPPDYYGADRQPLPGYRPCQVTNIKLIKKDDKIKINAEIQKFYKVTIMPR